MPEGKIFFCVVAIVEELAVVFSMALAVGSTMEGVFGLRWGHFHRGIATIACRSGSVM
jgi:cytochrome bd-type quinol oxidase subunit 1